MSCCTGSKCNAEQAVQSFPCELAPNITAVGPFAPPMIPIQVALLLAEGANESWSGMISSGLSLSSQSLMEMRSDASGESV